MSKQRKETKDSMDGERTEAISLKALVDKENNRVIFAEAGADLIDVLLSFLTMPMGTIIRLTRQPPALGIGCMNNLYESGENLDKQYFRTEACKVMLLYPQNGTAAQCKSLKLKIDDSEPLRYFLCHSSDCTFPNFKLLSHYRNILCGCGNPMDLEIVLSEGGSDKTVSEGGSDKTVFDVQDGGVFVKGLTRLLISDELQLKPPSTATCFSLLAKLGVMNPSTTEERTFDIGVKEVLKLLKRSFVSKTPLTDTLLQHNTVTELSKDEFDKGSFIKSNMDEKESNENGRRICVKLMVSKSKETVCYAEVREDFVDLVFSFLTLPLGYIVKYMHGCSMNGCMYQLYDSVQDLGTELYLKSNDHKAMLVSPKLAPGFSYEDQPLGIGEYIHPPYYYAPTQSGVFGPFGTTMPGQKQTPGFLISDATLLPSSAVLKNSQLSVMDPKSHYNRVASGAGYGYVTGAVMFIVTDDLTITPISAISGLSVLNKLKVPFSDIEERIVYIGNEEALRLLVASFVSKSALTNTFIRKEPKQEYQGNAS